MVDYATLSLKSHTEPFRSLVERLICYTSKNHSGWGKSGLGFKVKVAERCNGIPDMILAPLGLVVRIANLC